jgi:regulation of enolase protein 1 (concanavalin A-like superfamily)
MWVATWRADWETLKEAFHASLAAGGPEAFFLPSLLDGMEQTCHRIGADATFIGLCQEMAAGYARAGLTAPLAQWYLAPTTPSATAGEPSIREEFDRHAWDPALTWLDATGGSRVDHATRPGWLGLAPPVGCDLWPEADLNAPRLLATVQGDFVAQTRLELSCEEYMLAGLLLWRDEQNFVRLELRSRRSRPATVYLEACVAGRFRHIGRGQWERQPMWLRLERTGDEAHGLCSADGQQWLTCGVVRLPQGKAEQVGLAAITRDAAAHVWFDTFLLWSAEKRKG